MGLKNRAILEKNKGNSNVNFERSYYGIHTMKTNHDGIILEICLFNWSNSKILYRSQRDIRDDGKMGGVKNKTTLKENPMEEAEDLRQEQRP